MNLPRLLFGKSARGHSSTPCSTVRIWNITRQVELACSVEIADHGSKRRKGLLGHEKLAAGEGLWIIPCEAIHTFGMRFPIDLVYLDRSKRVRKVSKAVPPWRMSACFSAYSVLELASGSIRNTQTRRGDRLEFSSSRPIGGNSGNCDASGPVILTEPDQITG
jgi:uncharacterized membrane protein (UPF0127 family)